MPKILVQSAKAPVTGFTDASAPSPLAQAIRAGDFLYVSGQGPLDPVTMRVCLRNTTDFPAFNETFRDFMQVEKVTRTCTGGTPHRAGVNVEIDCVAFLG